MAATIPTAADAFCLWRICYFSRGVIFPTYGLAEHTVYVCSNGKDRLVVDRVMLETERKVVQVFVL